MYYHPPFAHPPFAVRFAFCSFSVVSGINVSYRRVGGEYSVDYGLPGVNRSQLTKERVFVGERREGT